MSSASPAIDRPTERRVALYSRNLEQFRLDAMLRGSRTGWAARSRLCVLSGTRNGRCARSLPGCGMRGALQIDWVPQGDLPTSSYWSSRARLAIGSDGLILGIGASGIRLVSAYQTSTRRPGTRLNSVAFRVTRVSPRDRAMDAIIRSFAPIIAPSRRRSTLTTPYCPAAASSKGSD